MPEVTAPEAFEATMLHGSPHMIDYQNGATAITAGTVVIQNGRARIAHLDIPANERGSLAAGGGDATYLVKKGSGEITAGTKVYWDNTNKVATATATDNTALGEAVLTAASADAHVRVRHDVAL